MWLPQDQGVQATAGAAHPSIAVRWFIARSNCLSLRHVFVGRMRSRRKNRLTHGDLRFTVMQVLPHWR